MKTRSNNAKSFLSRLRRSTSGNTLALGAAAVVPLVGMIGGGLDMSRAYLVKARVQQACDAATLAARKELAGSTVTAGNIPADVRRQANNFFNANFEDGAYGSRNTSFTLTAGSDTRMDGTASVELPMALMQVFGYEKTTINVDCSADLNLPNIDVMLVLDQSGSMNSGSRMQDLRDAVFAFYDEVEAVKPPGARVRIGVVPYSGTVNVGRILIDANPNWVADSWNYQTREAVFREVVTSGAPPGGVVRQIPANLVEKGDKIEDRKRYNVPYDINDWAPDMSWMDDDDDRTLPNDSILRWPDTDAAEDLCNDYTNNRGGTYIVGDEIWTLDSDNFDDDYFNNGPSNMRGACGLRFTRHEFDEFDDDHPRYEDLEDELDDEGRDIEDLTFEELVEALGYEGTGTTEASTTFVFDHYRHFQLDNLDTSQYKLFNTVQTPTGTEGAMVSSSWNGCIEERQTVATTTFDPIPTDAYDLDINMVPDPTDPDTQWKPQWNQITYARENRENQRPADYTTTDDRGTHSFNCPSEARTLREYPSSGGSRNAEFEAYINSLTPQGGTMHDIGMIWAGRFITPNGLFTAQNASAPNGDPISRHIIFMTDGEMGADPKNYIAYGNPNMDGRFMGFNGGGQWSEAQTAAVNNKRLEAICKRIKNENVTVWSVTFELPQNTFTRECASGTARAFEANGGAELAAAFRQIAGAIAELRLVN